MKQTKKKTMIALCVFKELDTYGYGYLEEWFELSREMEVLTFTEILTSGTIKFVGDQGRPNKALKVHPDTHFLYRSGCNLEWGATPRGVGLCDDDFIYSFTKSTLNDIEKIADVFETWREDPEEEIDISLAYDIRPAKESYIDFGLNIELFDECRILDADAMAHGHDCQEDLHTCQNQMTEFASMLLLVMEEILEEYKKNEKNGRLATEVFRPILNLLKKKYKHSADMIKDLWNNLDRSKVAAHIIKDTKSKSEGLERLKLINKIKYTVQSFLEERKCESERKPGDGEDDSQMLNTILNRYTEEVKHKLLVGPIRNFEGLDAATKALPTTHMIGVQETTTLVDILRTYGMQTEIGDDILKLVDEKSVEFGQFCNQDHIHVPICLKSFWTFQEKCLLHPPKYHLALEFQNEKRNNKITDSEIEDILEKVDPTSEKKKKKRKKKGKKKKNANQGEGPDNPDNECFDPMEYVKVEMDLLEAEVNQNGVHTSDLDDQSKSNAKSGVSTDKDASSQSLPVIVPEPVNDSATATTTTSTSTSNCEPSSGPNIPVVLNGKTNNNGTSKNKRKKKGKDRKSTSENTSSDKSKPGNVCDGAKSCRNDGDYIGGARKKNTQSQAHQPDVPHTQQTMNSDPGGVPHAQKPKYSDLSEHEMQVAEAEAAKSLNEAKSRLEETDKAAEDLINSMHTKLTAMQNRIDKNEDKKHANVKSLASIDADIKELTEKLKSLEKSKKNLLSENCQLQEEINQVTWERKQIEKEFEVSIAEKRKMKEECESLVEQMKNNLEMVQQMKEVTPRSESTISTEDNKNQAAPSPDNTAILIDFLRSQISAKEFDLECPVCLEVSCPPIFTCIEQHIICSKCWIKLRSKSDKPECVQCRSPYPLPPRHHRYMEKVAEELQQLCVKLEEFQLQNGH